MSEGRSRVRDRGGGEGVKREEGRKSGRDRGIGGIG